MQLTLKHLFKMLSSDNDLLNMLFTKRDSVVNYYQAKEFTKDGNIEILAENGLLINEESTVELDERLLTFLESVLGASDEIEIGNLSELLSEISSKIELYNISTSYEQRQKYIKRIDRILKKIPVMISKSLIKLHQHIHLTYKSADNYELKLVELKYYKNKLELLKSIDSNIESTLKNESNFFKNQSPPLTSSLYFSLKAYLTQMRISLVDLQRQVVDYINRVSPDVSFFKHMTRLKELKNSYEIREYTNIEERVKSSDTPLSLLPRFMVTTQLEKEYVYSVDFSEYVDRYFSKNNEKYRRRGRAAEIDEAYLDRKNQEEYYINTEDLHLEFQGVDSDLFSYVMDKDFGFEQSFQERLAIYCDMAGLYARDYFLSDEKKTYDDYEYLVIYPKEINESA